MSDLQCRRACISSSRGYATSSARGTGSSPESEIQTTAGLVESSASAKRAATCFSGGVDSLYTLLKYRGRTAALPSPLTHVLFMRGLEKPLWFMQGVAEAEALVQKTAAAVGVQCILGESNLRDYFDTDWLNLYCGSGLAAAALSLGGGLGHVCIPSSYSYRDPVPIGSTPLVDERSSTERVRIVHDGADLPRADKLWHILEWNPDLVLQTLRVCVMNFGGAYNCCECRKCVRTMIPLRALGMLDRAVTFPNKSTAHWAEVVRWESLPFLEENLAFVRAHNGDPALTESARTDRHPAAAQGGASRRAGQLTVCRSHPRDPEHEARSARSQDASARARRRPPRPGAKQVAEVVDAVAVDA